MNYFMHFGLILIIVVILLFVLTNIIYSLDRHERIKLIIKQIISITTLCGVLLLVDVIMQKIIIFEQINDGNILSCLIIYCSSTICLWLGVSSIFNKLIDWNFGSIIIYSSKKTTTISSAESLGTAINTEQKVLSSKDLPEKILIHSEKNLSENSLESKKIPEDIELVIFGKNVTTYKDGRELSQNLYACKNKCDETRISKILYESLLLQADSLSEKINNV